MAATTAYLKAEAEMKRRGYASLTYQRLVKNQSIILPCTSLGPGKFILVFFHSGMASRLRVDAVKILDPDTSVVKFSRSAMIAFSRTIR